MTTNVLSRQRQVWGRRQSRPLKNKERGALDNLWLRVSLELAENSMINPLDLFTPLLTDLWVEIGFGAGEHLAAQAAIRPHIGFVGCEPFLNGVAALMVQIQDRSLKNIRIVNDDARLFLARLPSQSTGRIFVLFPDPWPKKRHHKRRIVQNAVVTEFARVLKPGGWLQMATDDPPYAHWMQSLMADREEFERVLEGRANVYERPQDWPPTRYEQKAIAQDRPPVYLAYKRKHSEDCL